MEPIKPHPDGRVEFLRCDLCNAAFYQAFAKRDRRVLPQDWRDDWEDVNDFDERDLRFDKDKPDRL